MINLDTFHQQRHFYFDLYKHFLLYRDNNKVKNFLLRSNPLYPSDNKQKKIPKVLHYVWFGKKTYPELVKKCIHSWQNQEGFTIKLWNEDNFPIHLYPFAEQAYREKKWAMVSDVARLHALYYEGGIYLDTDIELINSLEPFLSHEAFACFESKRLVTISLFGAQPLHSWIGKVLSWYKITPFRCYYHEIANTRIISRMTELHYRVKLQGKNLLKLNDGMYFYSYDYFSPKKDANGEFIITDNTIAIHHGTGLW